MSISFQPIKKKRTFEEIVELLKGKIFSGEYQTGDKLPTERDFAQMIKVSRSAVREAYHALELFGIVEIRKGIEGGTFIKEPKHHSITQSINDLMRLRRITLDEMVETRLILEKDLATLTLQRIVQADYNKLENCIAESFEILKKGLPAHHQNIKFHLCLAEIAGNELLLMVYSSVMDLFTIMLQFAGADYEGSKIVAEEHLEIIELLKKGELSNLLNFVGNHIQGSNKRLLEISKGKPIPGLNSPEV